MNYSGKSHYIEALVLMVQVKVLLIDHYWPQKSGSLHAIPICSASLQIEEAKRSLFLEAESAFKSMSKLKEK